MNLRCPICAGTLLREDRLWRCERNHSFDIARQGYVNLLPVNQKHSLNPGDTRLQVLARREFLESGFYAPIARTLIEKAREYSVSGTILDAGCGEGYYASRLAEALALPLTGLDISKEAVRCAAGKYKDSLWLCASAAHIPVEDQSVGLLMSLFAVTIPEEFHRVLKEDGLFFQVLAAEDHLLSLKQIIYPELHHKEKNVTPELPGFALAETVPIRFSFTVEGVQVQNLLSMTPHVYRIDKAGAERLRQTESLTDEASCLLNIYRRS